MKSVHNYNKFFFFFFLKGPVGTNETCVSGGFHYLYGDLLQKILFLLSH